MLIFFRFMGVLKNGIFIYLRYISLSFYYLIVRDVLLRIVNIIVLNYGDTEASGKSSIARKFFEKKYISRQPRISTFP